MKLKENLRKRNLKVNDGITLIALVITLIVLLILAGISITMLSSDNSILSKATEAKESTERAQIEEAIKLAYMDLVGKDITGYSNTANLDKAIEEVQKNNAYKDKIISISGGAYKLSSTDVILAKSGTDNNQTLTIEEDTSASSGGTYYAVISGKYYKIEQTNGDIKIAKEDSNVDPNNTSDTISITSDDVTIAKTSDNKDIATFEVIEGNKVKVTASSTNEGSSTITIRANGKTYTANLSVVGTIQNAPATLDGALELLATTDSSNQNGANVTLQNIEMTTSNPDVATITTEGIVKCNKATGEAIISAKQGDTTTYFKVNSTATLATSKMTSNKTINNQTSGTSDNPLIPAGFYVVDTETAKWTYNTTTNKVTDVDQGLVIMDEKGNQFVWVPVRDIKDMVMCANNNKEIDGSVHHCNVVLSGNNLSCTATGHSDEIVGRLYATTWGEKFKDGLDITPYTYTQNSGLREPDEVTDYDNKQTQYTVDNRSTQLTKFKEMAISVAKNGGFYVARYESSLINNTTRVVAGATSMSATTDSANMWYGLYAKQNSYATENEVSSSVKSTMIWGSQYDAIMNWFGDSVATTAGGTNINQDTARRTGSKSTDKINNIFDLYGLRFEWTREVIDTYARAPRGGHYLNISSPSYRYRNGDPNKTNDYFGSRPTLYIQ